MEMTNAMRRCLHREPALRPPPTSALQPPKPAQGFAIKSGGLIARTETALESPLVQKPGKLPKGDIEPVVCRFTVPGPPVGKPRQTQSDKWKKRPCVLRYREWCDRARAAAPADLPKQPVCVSFTAYLPFPKSYTAKRREALSGQLHRLKPDADNLLKAIDGLWKEDSGIAMALVTKRWDDGNGPRVEIEVY